MSEILGKYSVHKSQWKMVHMPSPHGAGQWRLYDLENDLAETNDLSVVRPDIASELSEEWERYGNSNRVIFPDWVKGFKSYA